MKLLTKEVEKSLPARSKSKVAMVKFFSPDGSFTWYATEYNRKDKMFFGFVTSGICPEGEWGSFSLAELESVRGPLGLPVERDYYWKPQEVG